MVLLVSPELVSTGMLDREAGMTGSPTYLFWGGRVPPVRDGVNVGFMAQPTRSHGKNNVHSVIGPSF